MNTGKQLLCLTALLLIGAPLVSGQTTYKWTLSLGFVAQHPVALTAAALNLTSTIEKKQIAGALNAAIRNAIFLPAANISNPTITLVNSTANATCPGSLPTITGTTCSKVFVAFTLQYLNTSYPPSAASAASTNVTNAINAGYFQCRMKQLYPTSSILIRSGAACPENSAAPTRAPSRAPTMPPLTSVEVTNAFFISNTAGINDITLNTNGNAYKIELRTAYKSLLNKVEASDVARGATITVGSLSVANTNCPVGLSATCHLVSAKFTLRYYASLITGTPDPTLMQTSINAGNLICEHKRLYPSSLITVRSGTKCPTATLAPTPAPVITNPPTGAPTSPPLASATVQHMFRILHPSNITTGMLKDPSNAAAMQLLAAYASVVKTALTGFTATYPVKYGGYKLATIADSACATSSPVGSLCNNVTASFIFNFTSTDSNAPTTVSNLVNTAISVGKLDCELKRLYPTTLVQVTTGGICPSGTPNAIVYDKAYLIKNQFRITNTVGLSNTTLMQAGNPQRAELEAAFNAMLLSLLKGPIESGAAVLQRPGIITSFQVEPKCTSVTVCHFVSVEFKLKCNSTLLLPLDGLAVLNLVQTAINYGTMICYHTKLYVSSIVKVTTGETCKQTL